MSGGAISRRGFIELTGAMAMTALSGDMAQVADAELEPQNVERYGVLLGPSGSRPGPDFFESKWDTYQFLYLASDTGERTIIDHTVPSWESLPFTLKKYASADLPTDVPNGFLAHDTNRGLPAWWDRDHYEWPNFVDDVKTSPVTVANTTTRTTVFDPDINADSLVKGRKYQIQISGSFGTTNNSDTFTVDVNLAGATDLAGIGNAPANVTNAPWWVQVEFSVREDGTNGVLVPTTFGIFDSTAQQADAAHGTVSVDTTTVTNLSVDIQWSAADPDNTATVDQAHLIQMA